MSSPRGWRGARGQTAAPPGARSRSQEWLLELDMRRQRLITELGVDLAHRLVWLIVGGHERTQTLCFRARERLDLDRSRDPSPAKVAPDPGDPGGAIRRSALPGHRQSSDCLAVDRHDRRVGHDLPALEEHLTKAAVRPMRR